MLKWTGALAAAAVVGIGVGYGAGELLRPVTPIPPAVTTTLMQTKTETKTETVTRAATGAAWEKETAYACAHNNGACLHWVKNGRVIRSTPFPVGSDAPYPKVKVGNVYFRPPMKGINNTVAIGYRKLTYAANRILYPMKRVDFTPGGGSVSGRGKGEWVRISWAEATDIVASELKRVQEKYGPGAVGQYSPSNQEQCGLEGEDWHKRILVLATGGFTVPDEPTYSSAGWAYGGAMIHGFYWNKGRADSTNCGWDLLNNSGMLVQWASDDLITGGTGGPPDIALMYDFMKQIGKTKVVVIDPHFNETMAKWGDTWIPIIPGTDSALGAAIAYVWISEGTYDKAFVDTHCVGFDEEHLPKGAPPNSSFKAYITGAADGVPKTPEWAEKICGVKARIIRALAREWAAVPTMGGPRGGAHRASYGHEWARYVVALTAMQGYGKVGVNCHASPGLPSSGSMFRSPPGFADLFKEPYTNPIGISNNPFNRQLFTEGILNGTCTWQGDELSEDPERAFKTFTWPSPGYSVIRAWYCTGHSHFSARVDANKTVKAYMSPNLEFIVTASPWWGGTCTYSDVVLPITTPLEQSDINSSQGGPPHKFILIHDRIVEPLGESKSDFECGLAIAKKLGVEDKYAEGRTKEDLMKLAFARTGVGNVMSYDEFKKTGYIYNPSTYTSSWKGEVSQRWFYEKKGEEITGPENGFATPTGKVEIFSTLIFKHRGVNDPIIHPVPKFYPMFGGEKLDSPATKTYPLRLLTSHRWFRMHGMGDQISLLRECYKIEDKEGYRHEPAIISWADAEARGIENGDIIKIFNDRGATLAGAVVAKRMMPGAIKLFQGSWFDPVDPPNAFLDRSGCCQVICHSKGQSPGWAEKIPDVTAWVQIEKYAEGAK